MNALGDVDETTLDRFWGDKSWHQLWKEQKMGPYYRTLVQALHGHPSRLASELDRLVAKIEKLASAG